ncbi:MAG TPA: AsmA-like C-terminal region-containing protein [Pirellulales bacterium]|nr:AsmA-like C-terminal region-containing protein [Pirellulales bacterium]
MTRIGVVASLVVAAWLVEPAFVAGAPQASETRRDVWDWLKAKISRVQSAARRQATVPANDGNTVSGGLGWTFHEIDAADALGKLEGFGLKVPFEVAGRLTLRLRVGVPWETAFTARNYRLDAHVTSKRLKVAGIETDDVAARLSYADGLLRVESLRCSLPEWGFHHALASMRGKAELQLEPRGDLTASIDFEHLGLDEIVRSSPAAAGFVALATGELSGHFAGHVPVGQLRDPVAWHATGRLRVAQLRAVGLAPATLDGEFHLDNGRLTAPRLAGDADFLHFRGSAHLDLTAPLTYSATLRLTSGRLSRINEIKPDLRLPIEIGGRLGASALVQGTLSSKQFSIKGAVTARNLRLEQVAVDRLDFRYDADPHEVRVSSLDATLGAGRLQGSAVVEPGKLSGSVQIGFDAPYRLALALSLTNADLAVLNALPSKPRPPLRLAGRVGMSANFKGTLKPLEMSGNGNVSARGLRVGNIRVDSLAGKFSADGSHFEIERLQASLYQGGASGSLSVPLRDGVAAEANLSWRQLSVGALLDDLGVTPGKTPGHCNGKLKLRTAAKNPRDVAGWKADLDLDIQDLRAYGWPIQLATLRGRLDEGWLNVSKLLVQTQVERRRATTKLTAACRVKVTEPFDFKAQADVAGFDLARLRELPAKLRPPRELAGSVGAKAETHGTLRPLEFAARGSTSAKELIVNGARIDAISADFAADETKLELTDLSASFYEGELSASAEIPWVPEGAGRLGAVLRHVDLGHLASDVGRLGFDVRGRCDARLDATLPPGGLDRLGVWEIHASFDTPEITVDSIPLGDVHARLDRAPATTEYHAAGRILAGSWEIAGALRDADMAGGKEVNQGRLKIMNARLDRLGQVLRQQGSLESLAGTLQAGLDYRYDERSGGPVGEGRFEIKGLRLNGVDWSNRLGGVIRITPEQARLDDLTGALAGGSLHGAATFSLVGQRGSLRLAIDGAQIKRLLAVWPEQAKNVDGAADLRMRGFTGQGRPWRFNGIAALRQAKWHGIPLNDARLPLEATFEPRSGHGEIHLRDATARVALGRVSASANLAAAGGLRLDAQATFSDVSLQHLALGSSFANHFGSGKISGALKLAGHDVRSARDLTGTLKAKLRDTQATSVPLLGAARSYLGGGLSPSTRFQTGDVRARLADAVMHVERLSLTSSNARIYSQGTIALAGRLNLSAVINTGSTTMAPPMLLMAARLAALAAPPAALLLEASRLLANQVIYLDLRGTVRSPSIRVRPLPLLEEEVIRFFLL